MELEAAAGLFTMSSLLALLTLTIMEIVLGIDNIVFIAIITNKLPKHLRKKGRRIGLAGAMVMRIILLLAISWVMTLVKPLFEVLGKTFNGKELILLGGGLFLIYKATTEIHNKLEGDDHANKTGKAIQSFWMAIFQIMMLDLIFSLDSVITAVGMADHIEIMIIAVVIAVGVMIVFAEAISKFIEDHPTTKMLALAFLMLIGVMLVAEGFGKHIEKGYIYFAMGFSIFVEVLNLRFKAKKGGAAPIPSEPLPSE